MAAGVLGGELRPLLVGSQLGKKKDCQNPSRIWPSPGLAVDDKEISLRVDGILIYDYFAKSRVICRADGLAFARAALPTPWTFFTAFSAVLLIPQDIDALTQVRAACNAQQVYTDYAVIYAFPVLASMIVGAQIAIVRTASWAV